MATIQNAAPSGDAAAPDANANQGGRQQHQGGHRQGGGQQDQQRTAPPLPPGAVTVLLAIKAFFHGDDRPDQVTAGPQHAFGVEVVLPRMPMIGETIGSMSMDPNVALDLKNVIDDMLKPNTILEKYTRRFKVLEIYDTRGFHKSLADKYKAILYIEITERPASMRKSGMTATQQLEADIKEVFGGAIIVA